MSVLIMPWKRFGHDRLYVSIDGRRIGFRDLVGGTDHPEDEGDAALLTALVEAHLRDDDASTVEAVPPVPSFDSGLTDQEASVVVASARSPHPPEPTPVVRGRRPPVRRVPAAETPGVR